MLRFVGRQTSSLSKNLTTNPLLFVRTLKNEVKIKWNRPDTLKSYGPERSGDLTKYEIPDQSNICLEYELSTELNDAEPNVRNQFTLGWHKRESSCEFYKKTLIDSVRSHQYDYKSPAAIIAGLTGEIRFNQHMILENIASGPYRRKLKWNAVQMIRARMEMIRKLRETDYKQYEWLLERLDLQYKPKPDEENTILVARKEGLRRLTDAYCTDIRQQRLNEYRNELEAQQLPFLEQKLNNLIFIRNEQLDMKVNITITQEQIDETRERYEKLKVECDKNKTEPTNKKWKVY